MKKLVIIIFLLFSVKVLYSQNYYYYFGNKISLEQRTDKAAIVLNSGFFTKEFKEKNISEIINCDCDITEVGTDFYLINFKKERSLSEVQNFISAVSAKKDYLKFISPVYYGESKSVSQIPTDEFVVKLKDIRQKEFLDIINVRNNVRIIGNVSDEKGFLLKSNNGVTKNALELSEMYLRTGLFEYAEPNFIYPEFCLLNYTPNDPFYPKQWSLNNSGQSVPTGSSAFGDQAIVNGLPGADMDVDLAWDFTKGSNSIKIGVLDTGIDSTHPDFNSAGHLMTGYDAFYNKYGVPSDSGFYGGHGTCAAGLAGALINNSAGIAGVAPQCKLMAIRIFNLVGSSSVVQMSRAFDTARVIGLDVLSNSWTGGTASTTLTNAINNTAINGRGGLGCCIFFASGNDGHNSVWYPSYLENVTSVGGSTNQDQKKAPGTGNQYWWGGNYGEDENGDLDVVAPTVCYTTDIQGVYGYNNTSGSEGDYFDSFRGTSTSCPNAAGIAALILSLNPSQTRLEVTDKLYRGCDKIDNLDYSVSKTYGKWNKYCGYGRVNAYNSVRLAAGADVTPPAINHKNVSSASSTYPTIVTAEIIDQDGSPVPSSGEDQPKLLFRLNKNNSGWSSFDSVNANSITGNNFTFLIPCQGFETQVQYYIRAIDYNNNQSVFPRGAPNSSWLCYFSIGNFTTVSNKIGSFISADPGASFSPAVNFDNFTIVNSRVQIYLRHSNISDEIIELCSPISDANNNKKCLFASNGGSGADINGAVIADSAEQFWINGVPPYSNGIFKGDYILNGLNGTNAFGNWQILNYDQFTGNQAHFDSVIISLTKTSGTASPCARRYYMQDSVLDFGDYLIFPDSIVRDFYLKNTGNVNLSISSVTFIGIQPENFSLVTNAPGSILPGDSGIFNVKYRSNLENSSFSGSFEKAVMQIQTDDPSKYYFNVSLLINEIITPVELSSFTFNVSERNLSLNWTTVFEKNNSGFDIEKMRITGDTLKAWKKIGFVKGSGNSGGPNNYSYEDRKLSSGNFRYRLKQIDFNGIFKYYYLTENVEIDIPSSFALSQNYPNPFNPVTKIDYDIPVDGRISLIIYDISGRELSMLSNEFKNAGYFTSEFNGNSFASGIYFYRLVFISSSGKVQFTATKKMTLLK